MTNDLILGLLADLGLTGELFSEDNPPPTMSANGRPPHHP